MGFFLRFSFVQILLTVPFLVAESQVKTVRIAAASDLKFALDSIIEIYTLEKKSSKPEVTYGSSGKLFEQIRQSAPFDLYFSADKEYPEKLQKLGKTASAPSSYGRGRIVLWSRQIDPRKAGMKTLEHTSIRKIAIANPRHAPYGRRAEEALQYYQYYDQVKSRLVLGGNISQAAQYVTSGSADIGIVALSLALSPAMKESGGQYFLIPEEAHKPLEQAFVILNNGKNNPAVKAFVDFFKTDRCGSILAHFGFVSKD